MRLETNKDYYKTTSEQKIKANVDGTMRDLLKANGGLEHGTNHIDDKFKEATKNTIRCPLIPGGYNTLRTIRYSLFKMYIQMSHPL